MREGRERRERDTREKESDDRESESAREQERETARARESESDRHIRSHVHQYKSTNIDALLAFTSTNAQILRERARGRVLERGA